MNTHLIFAALAVLCFFVKALQGPLHLSTSVDFLAAGFGFAALAVFF